MEYMMQYQGDGWLRRNGQTDISELGEKVANMIGFAWQGIYHLDGVEDANWSDKRRIEIRIYGFLSTYDDSKLTWLVLACHHFAIRLEIKPRSHQYLTLIFSQRTRNVDSGDVMEYHRSIAEAIAKFHSEFRYPSFEGFEITEDSQHPYHVES